MAAAEEGIEKNINAENREYDEYLGLPADVGAGPTYAVDPFKPPFFRHGGIARLTSVARSDYDTPFPLLVLVPAVAE